MDIFLTVFQGADIVISSFYNIMLMKFSDFQNFLGGTYTLYFDTLVNSTSMALNMSLGAFGILDGILNIILRMLSFLFTPLPIFYNFNILYIGEVPFYLCFISFFVNGLLILGFIKLVAFVIELIPFE